jgi:dipeptidyl aminopeptidase/acylaminoacyl peptidase
MQYLRASFVILASVLAFATTLAAEQPYPPKYWAVGDVFQSASVSPDGKYLAVLKRPRAQSEPILEIYDAADLSEDPFRVNADPMEITGAGWVGDASMVVSLRQQVRSDIEGFNQGVFEGRLALLDVDDRDMKQFREVNPSVENLLVSDPDSIIISFQPEAAGRNRIDPRFRPRSYYRLDLDSGNKTLLVRGRSALGQVSFDAEGNPLLARGFDLGEGEFIWYYRPEGDSGWEEMYRQSEDSFERFSVGGPHPSKAGVMLVIAHNGHDRAGLWEFDPSSGEFGKLVFRPDEVDVLGVADHSNEWAQPDTIVGAIYATDRYYTAYLEETEAAVERQLRDLVPHDHHLRISSRSRDGQTLVVSNSGPKDPGSYYLLKDGMFTKLGSRNPLLESEHLSQVRYIEYQARDGMTIPAYVTMPEGEPPFPLVVVPHGGPFVGEVVGFDEWGQMLANNGYMVLQPQYRGSRNYGLEHYTSAFIDGGEGGKAMQDDLDDGALHLVEEGLADRDRLAMFGWSYGGYAALVAAARTPQIYQCVVAGAGVSDNLLQVNYYRDRLRGASRKEQLGMWLESVSPIDHVADVNIPMLIVHGAVDQRVPVDHSNRYREGLKEHGKRFEYLELEGADHFYNTLNYDHRLDFYRAMLEFLATDCGPEGL